METEKRDTFKAFNKAIKTLIRELISTYPDIPELKLGLLYYKMSKTLSYKRPQRMFNTLIAVPFYDHIINNNFEYILKQDIPMEDVEAGYTDRLKMFYSSIDDTNKEIVRNHLLCLLALNKKCIEVDTKKM